MTWIGDLQVLQTTNVLVDRGESWLIFRNPKPLVKHAQRGGGIEYCVIEEAFQLMGGEISRRAGPGVLIMDTNKLIDLVVDWGSTLQKRVVHASTRLLPRCMCTDRSYVLGVTTSFGAATRSSPEKALKDRVARNPSCRQRTRGCW